MGRDNDVDVKITDFGLAKRANKEGLKTFCGTPQYFAPEVLKRRNTVLGVGRYGKEADMWSVGELARAGGRRGGEERIEKRTQPVVVWWRPRGGGGRCSGCWVLSNPRPGASSRWRALDYSCLCRRIPRMYINSLCGSSP